MSYQLLMCNFACTTGLIASSQAIAYTIGKFLSGLLVDRVSPKLLFSLGLLFCGLSTLTFTGKDKSCARKVL